MRSSSAPGLTTEVTLASAEDLRRAIGFRPALLTIANFKISGDWLPVHERAAWQSRLEGHALECGCKEGALGMAILVIPYALYGLLNLAWAADHRLAVFGGGFLLALVGTGAGKIAGLVSARRRLKVRLEELLAVVDPAPVVN